MGDFGVGDRGGGDLMAMRVSVHDAKAAIEVATLLMVRTPPGVSLT